MADLMRAVAAIVGSCWRASRRRLIVSTTLVFLGSASGPLVGVALGLTTDAVLRHDDRAGLLAAAATVLAILSLTMEHFAHIFFFELADLHQIRVENELGEILQNTRGLAQHEDPEHADRVEIVRTEIGAIGESVQTVLIAFGIVVQIVLTAVLLAGQQPWLLILPAFAVPPLLAGRLAETWRSRAELATAGDARRAWHLLDLVVSTAATKEVRLLRLESTLRRRQAELRRGQHERLRRADLAGTLLRLAGQAVFALGYVGAVVLVVRGALDGRHSVGDVVLVITLAVLTNAQAAGAVATVQALQRTTRAVGSLRWLRDTAADTSTVPADLPTPSRLRTGVELAGVAFRYPGTDRDVLHDVDLRIPAGSTIAVVGENGAGKTTLVKLLCGFYEPTAGRITVDGVDLRRLHPAGWRSRISANFQDFLRLEAPVRDSVGVGDLSRLHDPRAISDALDRADARPVVDALPDGLDTHLGRSYADGVELSGGQWQRIALSRASMRPAPLVLLLDEPTSALDAVTEHALFERFAGASATVTGNDGITVLVSHRFSTVRMADLIVVLGDGTVTESGTHAELMRAGGGYADLFTLQASAYR